MDIASKMNVTQDHQQQHYFSYITIYLAYVTIYDLEEKSIKFTL